MTKYPRFVAQAVLAAAALCAAAVSHAETLSTAFAAAVPVSDGALSAHRGGAAAVTVVTDTAGAVQNNSAVNVVSGSNAVREGSFANAVGVSTVIQNSGSNVLIQNATTVNVQFN